jgi:hypothetical protein
MMKDFDCPLDVVGEARSLASQVEAHDLPSYFDPADLSWDQNVLRIAREYTNYPALSGQLRDWLVQAWKDGDVPCERCVNESDLRSELEGPECPHHWLAEQELSKTAQGAAERMYRTWLARRALDRRRGLDA